MLKEQPNNKTVQETSLYEIQRNDSIPRCVLLISDIVNAYEAYEKSINNLNHK